MPAASSNTSASADRLPRDAPAFADVWRLFATHDGVVVQTARAIFVWAHEKMSVIQTTTRFGRASLVDGRVYVNTPEAGLNVLEGNTLRPLPGTASLGNEPFPILLRYDDRRLLVGTRENGLLPVRRRLIDAVCDSGNLEEHAALSGHRAARTNFWIRDPQRRTGHHRRRGSRGDAHQPGERPAIGHGVLRHARPGRRAVAGARQRRDARRNALSRVLLQPVGRPGQRRVFCRAHRWPPVPWLAIRCRFPGAKVAGWQGPGPFRVHRGYGDAVLVVCEDDRPGQVGPIGPAPRVRRRPLRRPEQQGDPDQEDGRPELPAERAPRVEAGPDARLGRTVRRPRIVPLDRRPLDR